MSIRDGQVPPQSSIGLIRGLQEMLGSPWVRAGGDPGSYVVTVDPGAHHLAGTLPGGVRIRREIKPDASGSFPDLELEVPRGREIVLTRAEPLFAKRNDAILGGSVRLRFTGDGDLAAAWSWNARSRPRSPTLWVPEEFHSLSIGGGNFPHLPLRPIARELPRREGTIEVEDALCVGWDAAARVTVRLTGGGETVRLRALHLLCAGGPGQESASTGVFSARTGADGECWLRLPGGRYYIRPSTRYGDFPWTEFAVQPREDRLLVLPLW